MQNEEKKENKFKKFWYKHGDTVELVAAGLIGVSGAILVGITGLSFGYKVGYKQGFTKGINKGLDIGGKSLQLFIKKEVPEAYKMIDDYIISKGNLLK